MSLQLINKIDLILLILKTNVLQLIGINAQVAMQRLQCQLYKKALQIFRNPDR